MIVVSEEVLDHIGKRRALWAIGCFEYFVSVPYPREDHFNKSNDNCGADDQVALLVRSC